MYGFWLASELLSIFLVLYNYNNNASFENVPRPNWFISLDTSDIKFTLFPNPRNKSESVEIEISNPSSLIESGYDTNRPVKILVHGLLSNRKTASDMEHIKNAYLATNFPANIIMVDFGELDGINFPGYSSIYDFPVDEFSKFNAPIVGERIAQFIEFLIENRALTDPGKVHLIGFSLGCNIAGATGTFAKSLLSTTIGRISGLDCPSPDKFNGEILDKADASFVDITQTSISTRQFGHADFIINGGGPKQPRCTANLRILEPYCSHVSSVYYFAKSIEKQQVPGCKCQICMMYFSMCPQGNNVNYGQYVSKGAIGKYYVKMS